MGKFKRFLYEEGEAAQGTTSADIATVDNKLDMVRRYEKHANKGKKCKKHKKYNCEICESEKWND